MSLSPDIRANSPEPTISDVCMNLESQFMHDMSKAEGMHVFARVRPMLNSEVEAGYKECIGTFDDQTVRAVFPATSAKYKSSSRLSQDIIEDFKFTAAYGPEIGQFVFFEECMMNTMQNFIEGQNSLLFSYGITGSGKTFTLQGNPDNPGIIPLSLHLFFASIENQLLDRIVVKPDKFADVIVLKDNEIKKEHQLAEQLLSTSDQEEWISRNSSTKSLAMVLCETFSDKVEAEECQTTLCPEDMAQAQAAALMKELSKTSAEQQTGYCSIWVSFAEIYNESIYDLLVPNVTQRTKLTLGEDKNGDVYVKGLREICVFSSYEALKLLNLGQKNLKIASTKLNYQSSRSHCIFTIKVVRIPDPENITYAKINRLSFCDLAGSERAAKSQTTGLRLKEAGCINTSLLVLGRCLEQLRQIPSLREKKLIPFRESKLTRLLSAFFTGKGRAVMITNASPSELTFDETLHALRFSAVAKELIINDSYIATASNTLQTITNMWTNARANLSTSSDKSLSFEDSGEIIQEKDELIEKLLDLAESLRNNLEREKKEKAELEIKIRQDVCQEYSEYSDQLFENQKQMYEEERDTIKEIYKKRIASMEKMYEDIIKDYKLQIEESDSSCDEASESTSEAAEHKNGMRIADISKKLIKETQESIVVNEDGNFDSSLGTKSEELQLEMEVLKEDIGTVSEELKRTKNELQEAKDYCSALETAAAEMEKKLEICNSNLEKALAENGELKIQNDFLQASHQEEIYVKKERNNESVNASEIHRKQLEEDTLQLQITLNNNEALKKEINALKIDCVSYKADNDELFKKKKSLEEQLKCLLDELASTTYEKEDLHKKLTEAERNITNQSDEIKILLEKTSNLVELQKECEKEYEKSLKEITKKLEEADAKLNVTLLELEKKEMEISSLDNKNVALAHEIQMLVNEKNSSILTKKDIDSELDSLKNENNVLKEKLEFAKEKEMSLNESVTELKAEIDMLRSSSTEKEKKLCDVIKQHEKEAKCVEEMVKSLNETIPDVINTSKEYEEKYTDISKELELEKRRSNIKSCDLEKKVEEIKNLTKELEIVKSQCLEYENKVFVLLENKICMDEKLSSISQELELEKNKPKIESSRKEEIKRLTKELDCMKSECLKYRSKVSVYSSTNLYLQESLSSISKELELEKSKHNIECCQMEEIEKLTKELDSIKSECLQYENKVSALHETNLSLEEKLSFISKELELEKNKPKIDSSDLEKYMKEIEKLTKELNTMKSECLLYEKKVSALQETNLSLEENLSSVSKELDSERIVYKKEINILESKLEEALSTIEKQKVEILNLLNENNSHQNHIAELQISNKELEGKLLVQTSQIELGNNTLKSELDAMNIKLEEALDTVSKQKVELENILNESNSARNVITDLQNLNKELDHKINSQTSQTDILYKLIQVLESCELQATHKIDTMRTDSDKLNDEIENLKEKIKKNSDDQEKECDNLLKVIDILEMCELRASMRTKELHSSSIKHVEQIMDLENCVKTRNTSIESLKNDCNQLKKELKDLQATSKKQLQTEKQHYVSEISCIINEKTSMKKENETLKSQVTQLEAEKDKLEVEIKNIKNSFEKMAENKNQVIAEKENLEIELKNMKIKVEKEIEKKKNEDLEKNKLSEIDTEKFANSSEKVEKSPRSRTSKKVQEEFPKEKFSDKKISKRIKSQGDKRKNKQSNEKSEITSEDKKTKTQIYEETDENSNNENLQKPKRTGRRQLRCMENITAELGLVKNDDLISTKRKGSKRLHDVYDENISTINKPQNLRVKLLKAAVTTNDIVLPSPRMTRGRKKLFNLDVKENFSQNKGSPRSVRS